MTGSFPLELPPFTAAFLNGDMTSLQYEQGKGQNTIQQALLAEGKWKYRDNEETLIAG